MKIKQIITPVTLLLALVSTITAATMYASSASAVQASRDSSSMQLPFRTLAESNNPLDGDDCAGVETAFIKCDAKNSGSTEDNGIWALLLMVVNIMTAGVGILAVAGIVYGAVLYTTAEDKADQVKKATDIITNVVIGLLLFSLMWAGLNFVVPGGVFQ